MAALGVSSIKTFAADALGLLELGRGEPAEAVRVLAPTGRFALDHGVGEPGVSPWASDLAEAYVRTGQDDMAHAALAGLSDQAQRTGRRGQLPGEE